MSGPLLGIAALLALPLLILTAPAAATTTGTFAERSAQPGPPAHAAALSCELAEAKLQSAKKKLKRAKKKVAAAKKKVRKAKKTGKRAKVKRAKKKLKRAKTKLKKAKKRRRRAQAALEECDDGPPVVPPPPPAGNAQAVANAVLARAPQRPADINLFTSSYENGASGIYPQGNPMTPGSGPMLSESQARGQLASYLRERFGSASPDVGSALAMFDAQATKDLVAEPTLRAALIGLKGTLFEPAIANFLDSGNYLEARFGPLPNAAAVAAIAGSAGSRIIIFNTKYSGEDFRYLIPTWGHEVLHGDNANSPAEETINHALNAMTYQQLVQRDPELAHSGTELARFNNTEALLLLNSRERSSPDSEIYAPTGTGVAPGSPFDAPDLWTIRESEGSSPAPAVLGQIVRPLGLPTPSTFSQASAENFKNLNDSWLSDVERLRVAVLIGAISLGDITAASGLGPQQAIDLLGLQPYLDAAG